MPDSKPMQIGIICGGRSGEHEVSLQSAVAIAKSIDQRLYQPVLIGIDKLGQFRLAGDEPLIQDQANPRRIKINPQSLVVNPQIEAGKVAFYASDNTKLTEYIKLFFPIIHGTDGEDGAVQGMLRMWGVAFVGSDIIGSAINMHKDCMKQLLRQCGLRVARSQLITGQEELGYADFAQRWNTKTIFVKANNLGSSVGISKVSDQQQYTAAVDDALCYSEQALIEEAIVGRELECAVLELATGEIKASRCAEIIAPDGFYSYSAKYLEPEQTQIIAPAELSATELGNLQQAAIAAFKNTYCTGLARVDMFLEADGQIIISEVNTLPGFTAISMYPKLWNIEGISFQELISELLRQALRRHEATLRLSRNYPL